MQALVGNDDSFTCNLAHLLSHGSQVEVVRNDEVCAATSPIPARTASSSHPVREPPPADASHVLRAVHVCLGVDRAPVEGV